MTAMQQTSRSGRRHRRDTASLGATGLLVLATHLSQPLAADRAGYPEDVLSSPSKAVLLAEKRGRVTIYDGLEQRVVDRALDNQFDRIGSMMFVRTRQSLPDGAVASDDDCD